MKNGIITENGQRIYYKDGKPYHAGVVEIEGDIYYIGHRGVVTTGQHIVHGEMSNGILKRGTYTFSEEGKLIKGTYIPPKTKRRKHRKHKNKNKKSLWKRINKKTLGLCAGLMAFFVILIVVAIMLDVEKPTETQNDSSNNVVITLREYNEPVSLCSKTAQMLYKGECTHEQITGDTPYKAFIFEYTLKGADGELRISEYPDMRNSRSFILSCTEESVAIDNLKTGYTYYFEVLAGEERRTGSFSTEVGRRYVNIPGAGNTRDIGGYVNSEGKTLRQGMIIRGTELDGLGEPDYYLSNTDAETVLRQFGFVYEMDLRASTIANEEYTSRLGAGVKHKFYNAPMYGNIFSPNFKASLKNIFTDLAKAENYPMYMHCTQGADRTGTVVFLLQGILGMSDEDIINEYRLTAFVNSNFGDASRITAIIDGLENYKGDTLSEKITDFLVSDVGITEKEIESIRSILLEE